MEKAKFTRGEWKVKSRTSVVAGEKQVAETGFKMGGWPKEAFEEEEANAALIAAAPLLYLLVRDALDDPDSEILGEDWNQQAAKVVALAEGGAE